MVELSLVDFFTVPLGIIIILVVFFYRLILSFFKRENNLLADLNKIVPYFMNKNKKEVFVNGNQFDEEITRQYAYLLETDFSKHFPSIEKMPLNLRLIIVLIYDQISRHVYRNQPNKIKLYTAKNLPYLALKKSDLRQLALKELAYFTLACRHLLRQISLNQTDYSSQQHQQVSSQLESYLGQLGIRIQYSQKIGDETEEAIEFAKAVHSQNTAHFRLYRYIQNDYNPWAYPLDYDQLTETWLLDFLEHHPAAQYLTNKWQETCLSRRNSGSSTPIIHQPVVDLFIMVSGGVDSMTMARTALAILASSDMSVFKNSVKFHFVHINWHKRNEATLEADELVKFFNHFNHLDFDFQLVDSTVDPQNKDWDRKSTDFRFDLMRNLSTSNSELTLFCLGHVAEDLLENLVCNTALEGTSTGKQTCLDLFGMQELVKTGGIWLYRPLLLHHKPDDYGHTTPHLKDNAVNLDIKRRIVRRLVTNLEFDVSRIRTVYADFQDLRSKYVDLPLHQAESKIPQTEITANYWWLGINPDWTFLEWKFVLSETLNRLTYPMVKQKAIRHLRDRYLMSSQSLLEDQIFPFYQDMNHPYIKKDGLMLGFLVTGTHLGIPVLD